MPRKFKTNLMYSIHSHSPEYAHCFPLHLWGVLFKILSHLIWIAWNDLTFGPMILSALKIGTVPKHMLKVNVFTSFSDITFGVLFWVFFFFFFFCHFTSSYCRESYKLSSVYFDRYLKEWETRNGKHENSVIMCPYFKKMECSLIF